MSAATQFDLIGQFSLQHGGGYSLKIKLADEAGDTLPLAGDVVATIFAGRSGGELLAIDCPIAADEAELSISAEQILALPVGRLAYHVRQLVDAVEPRLLIGGQCDVLPVGAGVVRARDSVVSLQLNEITVSCTLVANAGGGGSAGAVRFDVAQDLTQQEQDQGCNNISATKGADFNALAAVVATKASVFALSTESGERLGADEFLLGTINDLVASLGDAAHKNTGTTSGTVAAGDDPRFSGGGGLAIGAEITGATANRILQSASGGTTLQQQGTWFFADLGFGAIMPTRQVLRTAASDSGFIANFGSGIIMGRADNFPSLYVGASSFNGCVVQGAYGWGNNTNSPSSCDAKISRRAANIVKGAALAALTYTVATKPDEATWIDCTVVFVDSSRGRRPCYSDGTNWRFYSDDAILS